MVRRPDTFEQKALRVYIVLGVMLLGISRLVVKLWALQVSNAAGYAEDLQTQSIRCVRVPGSRGLIFDRSGVCLADNRPSYCVAIYLSEFRQSQRSRTRDELATNVNALVTRLSVALDLEPEVSIQQIKRHIKRRSPLPVLAWRDVGEKAIAILKESTETFPGVDVYIEPVRVYPRGAVAAHVIGYVGSVKRAAMAETESFHYYLPQMVGKRGIEAVADDLLKGQAGAELLRVNVSGFTYTNLPGDVLQSPREATSGSDIKLTIDLAVQQAAEDALGETNGAVVVVDPRSGDVLALASWPRFDPNLMADGFSIAEWAALTNNPGKPLLNKAVSGAYPPGSTFKPIVAAAALDSGRATSATSFDCPGYYELGRTRKLNCWIARYDRGHGLLSMHEGIMRSCNTYFCHLGVRCGYRNIHQMARRMGLGRRTGVGVDGEVSGLLPDPSRIRARGHIANISIGQGALLVTPIQMAMVAATLGNGGVLYKPRFVLAVRQQGEAEFVQVPPVLKAYMKWNATTVKTLKNAMRAVVHSEHGTAKRARVDGLTIGGKTGTAEFGPKAAGRTRGWMIAFAPFDEPRVAVAMIVEEAVSGGRVVAPRVKLLLTKIFGGKTEETDADAED